MYHFHEGQGRPYFLASQGALLDGRQKNIKIIWFFLFQPCFDYSLEGGLFGKSLSFFETQGGLFGKRSV